MIRLLPYPCDQFDESQSYGVFFRKKGRGLPNAYNSSSSRITLFGISEKTVNNEIKYSHTTALLKGKLTTSQSMH